MSQPCQKRDTRTSDMVAPKHGMKNGFLKHLKYGFNCAAAVPRSNSAEDLLTGRSAKTREERSRKRSATDCGESARGLTMCIDKPQDRARVASSPERVADAEMPAKQKNHRRRRRRRAKPAYAPPPAAPPQSPAGIRIERSPTKQDFIFCVESTSPSKTDLKKQAGDDAPCASKASPPYVNSAIAFILGGNDDLSDTSSDWDEVDDYGAGSDFTAVDVLVMPLLNSLLSVSALSDSCPLRRCNGDQVDGPRPAVSPLVRNANEKWNRNYYGEDVSGPPRSAKVSFPVGDQLVEVHNADDMERKGPWEQIAVDRRRFQSRIASVESVLAPVLSREHRQKVYQEIYASDTE
ncbi:hypothetical protein MTO96_031040 [Rhipicephalus appendiculatus]